MSHFQNAYLTKKSFNMQLLRINCQQKNIDFQFIDNMTEEIQTKHLNAKTLEKTNKLTNDLLKMLNHQILENTLQVNEKKINLYLNKNNILEQPFINKKNLVDRKFQSKFTKEDQQKLKQLQQAHRHYQQELQKKRILYEDQLLKFQQEEKQLLQKQKKEINQEKLKEVSKHISEIRQRQQRRKHIQEEQQKEYDKMKQEKRLYQKMNQHWKAIMIQQEREKAQSSSRPIVNMNSIKEHEKKYAELMKQHRMIRQQKIGDLCKNNMKKYQQSKFYQGVVCENERIKQQIEQKRNALKQFVQKKIQYGQMVRKKHLPPKGIVNPDIKAQLNKAKSMSALNGIQMYRCGNEYMRQVHSDLKSTILPPKIKQLPQPFKYKNYLAEIKIQRKEKNIHDTNFFHQIDNIMMQKNITHQERFYKARQITKDLQTSNHHQSQQMIQAINAKIHLLKKIIDQ